MNELDCIEFAEFPQCYKYLGLGRVEFARDRDDVVTGIYRDNCSGDLKLVTGKVLGRWWSFPLPPDWA